MKRQTKRNKVKKVNSLGEPLGVASQLSHCDGFIFLDSSGNLPQDYEAPLTVIAVNPVKVYRGQECDFSDLKEVVAQYEVDSKVPAHIPQGGLFGWVEYEGDFCFGLYEHCLVYDHAESEWYEVGDRKSVV